MYLELPHVYVSCVQFQAQLIEGTALSMTVMGSNSGCSFSDFEIIPPFKEFSSLLAQYIQLRVHWVHLMLLAGDANDQEI